MCGGLVTGNAVVIGNSGENSEGSSACKQVLMESGDEPAIQARFRRSNANTSSDAPPTKANVPGSGAGAITSVPN